MNILKHSRVFYILYQHHREWSNRFWVMSQSQLRIMCQIWTLKCFA